MKNKLAEILLNFLHTAVYDYPNTRDFFQTLTAEQKDELWQAVQQNHLEAFFYYALSDVLPVEKAEVCKRKYQHNSFIMLKNKSVLTELYQTFELEKIRFAPFKGADLAYRCYPVPAVRYMSDFDILIHPDDCRRALAILQKNQWEIRSGIDYKTLHHHYVQHFKSGCCLEPHRTFAQFGTVPPRELWQYIHPVSPGSMQHRLDCELNLLQLTCHAASWHYNHLLPVKLLLDAAFLLRCEPPDWEKLCKLCKHWNLPYPGNLLSAYPELFFEEDIKLMQGDAESAGAYRQLLESNFSKTGIAPGEFDLYDERGGLKRGIFRGIKRMNTAAIRVKYQLPEQRAYLRLGWYMIFDLTLKIFRFLHYMLHPDQKLKKRRQLIAQAERTNCEKKK